MGWTTQEKENVRKLILVYCVVGRQTHSIKEVLLTTKIKTFFAASLTVVDYFNVPISRTRLADPGV